MDEQGISYDYEFLAVNKAYEKLMGVQAHNLINKRFYEVFPIGWEGEKQWKEIFNESNSKSKSHAFGYSSLLN